MTTPNRNLIFDIGMHIGQDTEFYLKKGFKVVAIEANPALVEAATDRFAPAIASGQLTICHSALTAESGSVDFFVCENITEWSSVNENLAARDKNIKKISVDGQTYCDLANEFGTPYYMKIDIEGADLIPILGLSKAQMRPVHVSYEAFSLDGAALLYALGYKWFKLVGQRNLPKIAQPETAREGLNAVHQFPLGSSGPFGEETPGPWSRFDDCASDYTIYRHFRRSDSRRESEWADIHAKSDRFAKIFAEQDQDLARAS
ncbi:FkbM family methyltransferase [Rhodobacteraceae bacterium]|nr:FkbM family methyltransferase [Paracoccaceae bacterium]